MESIDHTRIVRLTGNIDVENSSSVCEKITKLFVENPKKPITLIVMSPGGHVPTTIGAYEYLKKIITPNLITVALGEISSMAPIFFLTGKRRIVGKYTTMFFHNIGTTIKDRRLDVDDLKDEAADIERMQLVYFDIFSKNTGIKKDLILKWMREKKTLTAQEILEYGIATEILEDPL